jgi:hypothetical protein
MSSTTVACCAACAVGTATTSSRSAMAEGLSAGSGTCSATPSVCEPASSRSISRYSSGVGEHSCLSEPAVWPAAGGAIVGDGTLLSSPHCSLRATVATSPSSSPKDPASSPIEAKTARCDGAAPWDAASEPPPHIEDPRVGSVSSDAHDGVAHCPGGSAAAGGGVGGSRRTSVSAFDGAAAGLARPAGARAAVDVAGNETGTQAVESGSHASLRGAASSGGATVGGGACCAALVAATVDVHGRAAARGRGAGTSRLGENAGGGAAGGRPRGGPGPTLTEACLSGPGGGGPGGGGGLPA